MISLTRINGQFFTLNVTQIETIEATPDTVITLLNGRTYMVKEPVEEVVKMAIKYLRQIHSPRRWLKKGRA